MDKIKQFVTLWMRNFSILALIIVFFGSPYFLFAQKAPAPNYPYYAGNDLGLRLVKGSFQFRVWAPAASQAILLFYKQEKGGEGIQYPMQKAVQGTWTLTLPASAKGGYYTYRVNNISQGTSRWSQEVTDPYSIAVGTNGARSAIIDLRESNPKGWKKSIAANHSSSPAIIYELQIRDASKHISSGIKQKGKYLGLTERNTQNDGGQSTGLEHIKELGVTHVHLLPCFDFKSSDESKPDPPYNWGYDPQHYNVPEGTFATDTKDPIVRIREFKQMIQAFHQAGLKVVLDVVYNHTAQSESSHFEQLAPGYYYRMNRDGSFSNASFCGNETASENPMMRKFMLQSVQYWLQEYQVDGFRFDLMGIHDTETMNQISKTLQRIRPDILLYGEGWTAGYSPLPDSLRALKQNVSTLKGIAVFSDEFRDGIKGSVFIPEQKGFVSGNNSPVSKAAIEFGLQGGWTNPRQMIAYADCHDNHTLWDKLSLANPDRTKADRMDMHKLAMTLVLTSQGIPFLHAGSEFLRSKGGVENSFESPDSVNAIDWNLLIRHSEVNEYVKSLIALRKTHPAFWLEKPSSRVSFGELDSMNPGLITYRIDAREIGDSWSFVQVLCNGSEKEIWLDTTHLSWGATKENWILYSENNKVLTEQSMIPRNQSILLKPFTASILFQQ